MAKTSKAKYKGCCQPPEPQRLWLVNDTVIGGKHVADQFAESHELGLPRAVTMVPGHGEFREMWERDGEFQTSRILIERRGGRFSPASDEEMWKDGFRRVLVIDIDRRVTA